MTSSVSGSGDGGGQSKSLLEIEHLTKRFGGLVAVSDFSLRLGVGDLVGLIGPNGAGKTTVFNLITGAYAPTEGVVRFDGKNLAGLKGFEITQKGVARTFQNIRLFNSMTVLDNIKVAFNYQMGYNMIDAIIRRRHFAERETAVTRRSVELLQLFGLHRRHAELARNLPYGEQRRLEIARALATRPKLLLLDEPAAGMNPNEIDALMGLIQWIRKEFDLTILLIEHQMRIVMRLCQRITVIDFGQTIAEGTPEEVQNNRRVIEAYLGEAHEGNAGSAGGAANTGNDGGPDAADSADLGEAVGNARRAR